MAWICELCYLQGYNSVTKKQSAKHFCTILHKLFSYSAKFQVSSCDKTEN